MYMMMGISSDRSCSRHMPFNDGAKSLPVSRWSRSNPAPWDREHYFHLGADSSVIVVKFHTEVMEIDDLAAVALQSRYHFMRSFRAHTGNDSLSISTEVARRRCHESAETNERYRVQY